MRDRGLVKHCGLWWSLRGGLGAHLLRELSLCGCFMGNLLGGGVVADSGKQKQKLSSPELSGFSGLPSHLELQSQETGTHVDYLL